ncbi:hypothetical protein TRIUR3_18502 [Triticum urartu]|uniref:DUF1618 domain-containing protein n=1 Tax=Triticum urartu TaxID=4572 RepID=M7ZTQ3_TRIUA|nr:hypothetical protein TRIUR3_18502 [Triticum urartu]
MANNWKTPDASVSGRYRDGGAETGVKRTNFGTLLPGVPNVRSWDSGTPERFEHWGSRNATTATSKTSTGLPIAVTFCAARPPVLSHFSFSSAACPEPEGLSLAPKVISADADLVLLRVPVQPFGESNPMFSDYFVYRAHSQIPKLDLLPKSAPYYFGDKEIAILSCGDGKYAVASLQTLGMCTFKLHVYRSRPVGKPGSWTSKLLDIELNVKELPRDNSSSISLASQMLSYHQTTKVITLGGAKGTVGWVDLWRGILLCDVLEISPTLRDVPLPSVSKSDWRLFLDCCPYYFRDIIVDQSKSTIKHYKLLHKLMSGSANKEGNAAEEVLSLESLRMAYPTLSITDGDDIVYLLAKGTGMRAMPTVFSVDLSMPTLRGVAKLPKRHLGFMRYFLASGISKHITTPVENMLESQRGGVIFGSFYESSRNLSMIIV